MRKVIAVVAGLIIVIILMFMLLSISFIREQLWLAGIVILHLPPFVGGIIAGYIARRKGWIFGLLAVIFIVGAVWVSSIITWYQVRDDYIYKALHNGGFISFRVVLLSVTMLVVGGIGGHLGQYLAQKRQK